MFFSFSSRVTFSLILSLALSPHLVFSDTLSKEATYYSDVFEWGSTANGEIFSQSNYSAAICGTPLSRLLYVSKGWTWVVVKANDRPNCNRYPNVIDLSRDAFALLAPTSAWRIGEVQVTDIGAAPVGQLKWFLPLDIFEHLGVRLASQVPTMLFSWEGMTIRGKVIGESKNVTIALFREQENLIKNPLISVEKDGTFQAHILLPKEIGSYIFIVAKGNGFSETSQYATLALIDKNNLFYPSLPMERYKVLPRISAIQDTKSIILPDTLDGDIVISQWNDVFRTSGKTLLLSNTGLKPGKAHVQMSGYLLSTPSPLDRRSRVNSLFSGSVILDRKHESIGADRVNITVRNNNANIRFITPSDFLLRPNYYITLPSGDVKEYTFPSEYIWNDKYLKQGVTINIKLSLPQEGNFMLEIVRQDGIAYVNIPIARWNIWSIIDPLADIQIRTIRKNVDIVRASILDEINILRKNVSRVPVILDHTLSTLAQAKVDDMILRNYQSHADPDGKYIDALAQRLTLDIEWGLWENIWYGNVSDLALQDGLEESWVHTYNMLQSSWKRVGIGYGIKNDKVYLVHVFGE